MFIVHKQRLVLKVYKYIHVLTFNNYTLKRVLNIIDPKL